MLRKQRVVTAVAITAFWLLMVGIFLYREGWFVQSDEITRPAHAFKPQDQWMGIYVDENSRVGHLHLRTMEVLREDTPGYSLDLDVHLATSLFGLKATMEVTGHAWTSHTGDVADFSFSLASGEYRMNVEGALADGYLRGMMQTGGESIPLEFPVRGSLFPEGSLGMPGAGMPPLEPGESATIQAFDPTTMKLGDALVTCLADESLRVGETAYDTRVYATTIGAMTTKAWVTADEEVIQATTPFGFTLRKLDPETLAGAETPAEPGDMIAAIAIFPKGQLPQVDAARLRVRISGIDPETVPNDPPWQQREGDVLNLRQPGPLPDPAAGDTVPIPDFDTTPYLASDPFVTADHSKIIEKAKAIVGEESNPWKQSVLLYTWLYENIEKTPVLSVPNALDVLRTSQGDCNEHTVFFTALARSLGIPCRIAIGIVYSDTLGGFGYHAWPEVYYGQWYPMDPTLGQLAADATHIKLLNGSIEAWVQLVGFVGQIKLDVMSIE